MRDSSSSVTPLTVLTGINVELLDQFASDVSLCFAEGWLPVEIHDFIQGTQMVLGIPVALKTPAHAQRLIVVDDVHFIHATMTTNATDAAVDVQRMIEVSVIRNFVNSFPIHRIAAGPTFSNGRKQRAGCLDLRVAAHARLRRWHIRMRRTFDIRVTVKTRHPQCSRVKFMREWNRLLWSETDASVLRSDVKGDTTRHRHDSEDRNDCDAPEENIRSFSENHWHEIVRPSSPAWRFLRRAIDILDAVNRRTNGNRLSDRRLHFATQCESNFYRRNVNDKDTSLY